MKKVIMRIVVILLCAFLLAFPAYGSTTQPTTIYSCDSLPATMSQGEIVTDFGFRST